MVCLGRQAIAVNILDILRVIRATSDANMRRDEIPEIEKFQFPSFDNGRRRPPKEWMFWWAAWQLMEEKDCPPHVIHQLLALVEFAKSQEYPTIYKCSSCVEEEHITCTNTDSAALNHGQMTHNSPYVASCYSCTLLFFTEEAATTHLSACEGLGLSAATASFRIKPQIGRFGSLTTANKRILDSKLAEITFCLPEYENSVAAIRIKDFQYIERAGLVGLSATPSTTIGDKRSRAQKNLASNDHDGFFTRAMLKTQWEQWVTFDEAEELAKFLEIH